MSPVQRLVDATRDRDAPTRFALARDFMYSEVDAASPSDTRSRWTDTFSELLDSLVLDAEAQQRLLQTVTWRSRVRGFSDPLDGVLPGEVGSVDLWRVYCAAYFRRFEFKFGALDQLTRIATRRFPDELMLRVFSTFAALGVADPGAGRQLASTYDLVRHDPAALDTLLHGVWLSTDALPDQDEWILELSSALVRLGDQSANVYFWRSSALRRRGEYEKALASIDEALARHTLRDNHVHQDYVRERELIRAMQGIATMLATSSQRAADELGALHRRQLDEATAEFRQRAIAAEDTVAKSLTGVVEILGVFLALLGFLAGTGYLALNTDRFWRSLAAFAVLAVGSLAFLVCLRIVVRPDRRTP